MVLSIAFNHSPPLFLEENETITSFQLKTSQAIRSFCKSATNLSSLCGFIGGGVLAPFVKARSFRFFSSFWGAESKNILLPRLLSSGIGYGVEGSTFYQIPFFLEMGGIGSDCGEWAHSILVIGVLRGVGNFSPTSFLVQNLIQTSTLVCFNSFCGSIGLIANSQENFFEKFLFTEVAACQMQVSAQIISFALPMVRFCEARNEFRYQIDQVFSSSSPRKSFFPSLFSPPENWRMVPVTAGKIKFTPLFEKGFFEDPFLWISKMGKKSSKDMESGKTIKEPPSRKEEFDYERTALGRYNLFLSEHALPKLSRREEKRLFKIIEKKKNPKKIKKTKDKIARSVLRLVVSITKYFKIKGEDRLDLIAEGNRAVSEAIEKFEWRKGFRFSTWAGELAEKAMLTWIGNNYRTIRLDSAAKNYFWKVKREIRQLEKNGITATPELVAERLKIDLEMAQSIFIFISFGFETSLSKPIQREEGNEGAIENVLGDSNSAEADHADSEYLKKLSFAYDRFAQKLSDFEREVFMGRLLLREEKLIPRKAIAKRYGKTEDRTKRTENELKRRLKDYLVAEGFGDF